MAMKKTSLKIFYFLLGKSVERWACSFSGAEKLDIWADDHCKSRFLLV